MIVRRIPPAYSDEFMGIPPEGVRLKRSGQISLKCQVQWIPSSWGLAWHPHKLGLSQIFVAGREVFTSPDSSTKPCLEMESPSKDWCNWCDCNYIGVWLQLVWYTLYTVYILLLYRCDSWCIYVLQYIYATFSWGVIIQMIFKILNLKQYEKQSSFALNFKPGPARRHHSEQSEEGYQFATPIEFEFQAKGRI